MDAPKCRACGQRHWSPPCPTQDRAESKPVAVQPKKVEVASTPPVPLPHRVEPKAGGFDRVAYHREYMRSYMKRRRAAAKQQTNREQNMIKP